MRTVLLDASAIVALHRADDPFHRWAKETLSTFQASLRTCEPVLAETTYLLRKIPGAALNVLNLVADEKVELSFHLGAELHAVRMLMWRYQKVPMSLADACLVRMSELDTRSAVMTFDSDFRIYRRNGRGVIPLITPG